MLPTRNDLDPADLTPDLPLRDDGALDLEAWVAYAALLRTVARKMGADPDAGVTLHRDPVFGWRVDAGAQHLLIASMPGVGSPWVVRDAAQEPDTPRGRRRALVRIWRALRAPR